MNTSAPYIRLDDLALRNGERWWFTYPLEIDPVILGGASYTVLLPEGLTVVVDRVVGGFLVHVSLAASVHGPCERCLQEAVVQVKTEEEEFVPVAKDGWKESEFSEFIQGLVVDVKGLTREALVLALPTQIICSPSCQGLCPSCGQNLNLESCDCASATIDPRWNKLKDLKLEDDS